MLRSRELAATRRGDWQADVERRIEAGFAGESVGASKALGGLALCGVVTLVVLVAGVVAIVLLVKLVV